MYKFYVFEIKSKIKSCVTEKGMRKEVEWKTDIISR
jgi:hypothetical protein